MGVKLPNGATIAIASALAAAIPMSALSNAANAIATLEADHGVVANDIIVLSSGWSGADGRVVRASAVAAAAVTLAGLDTTSANKYPAGGGVGSIQLIEGWTPISQLLEISMSGGEQQFATYSFLEDEDEHQIPSVRSAQSLTLSLADDQSLPWYAALESADEDREPRAIRVTLPNGSVIYYNAYVSFNKTPSLTKNQVMALSATLSLVSKPMRYAV